LAILSENESSLMIWNYKKELEDNLLALEDHEDQITVFKIYNHKYIFTGSKDKTVKKW
jgi:WD40 repeat protein